MKYEVKMTIVNFTAIIEANNKEEAINIACKEDDWEENHEDDYEVNEIE